MEEAVEFRVWLARQLFRQDNVGMLATFCYDHNLHLGDKRWADRSDLEEAFLRAIPKQSVFFVGLSEEIRGGFKRAWREFRIDLSGQSVQHG